MQIIVLFSKKVISRINLVNTYKKQNKLRYIVGVCVLSLQLYPTLCKPMNCSAPGSSAHGILQARILEWVDMPSFRGSSQPRDRTHVSCKVSCTGRRVLHHLCCLGSPVLVLGFLQRQTLNLGNKCKQFIWGLAPGSRSEGSGKRHREGKAAHTGWRSSSLLLWSLEILPSGNPPRKRLEPTHNCFARGQGAGVCIYLLPSLLHWGLS